MGISKNKNKKAIIIVATLITTIGISLAYFVSSVVLSGSGASTSVTTATIHGATLKVEGELTFTDYMYPGHQNISAIKLTATGDNEFIPYNLVWKGTNTIGTSLNYTVYKTSSPVDVSISCKKSKKIQNGAQIYQEECTSNNIELLGTAISSGSITTSNSATTITLVPNEFITATSTGTVFYYYVILEYPNLDSSQNTDIGGTFNGKVTVEESDAQPDVSILAVQLQSPSDSEVYTESNSIPTSGYVLNTTKSVCNNGATPTLAYGSTSLTINNLTTNGTSCYLYFDVYIPSIEVSDIVANAIEGTYEITEAATTNEGLKYVEEDGTMYSGTTYYYRGAVNNNWVYFAGMYWRIIRFNGDGSIRIIYSGTAAPTSSQATVMTGTGTQTTTSTFNPSKDNNMYVGWKYTSEQVHGTGTSSTIRTYLVGENGTSGWYSSSGLSSYANYLADGKFCNDRQPSTSTSSINGSGGTGTTQTYYAANFRIYRTYAASFGCQTSSDIFAEKVGLITADEVAMAGGVNNGVGPNRSYYLYTSNEYWTMTPSVFNSAGEAVVLSVYTSGAIVYGCRINDTRCGIRPVINLKTGTTFKSGTNGTWEHPYEIYGLD